MRTELICVECKLSKTTNFKCNLNFNKITVQISLIFFLKVIKRSPSKNLERLRAEQNLNLRPEESDVEAELM